MKRNEYRMNATVCGNREVTHLTGLRGVLVVARPALINHATRRAFTQGDLHPIP